MKLTMKIAAGCFLASGLLSAAPPACITGTLASYIALGAQGCTFDGNVFANFAYSGNPIISIRAAQIEVTPALIPPETAKFSFSAPWSVLGHGQQVSIISYTAVLPCGDTGPAQLQLTLGSHNVATEAGSVSVVETTNVGKLSVFASCFADVCHSKTIDSLNFNPVSVELISVQVGVTNATLSGFTLEVVQP